MVEQSQMYEYNSRAITIYCIFLLKHLRRNHQWKHFRQ